MPNFSRFSAEDRHAALRATQPPYKPCMACVRWVGLGIGWLCDEGVRAQVGHYGETAACMKGCSRLSATLASTSKCMVVRQESNKDESQRTVRESGSTAGPSERRAANVAGCDARGSCSSSRRPSHARSARMALRPSAVTAPMQPRLVMDCHAHRGLLPAPMGRHSLRPEETLPRAVVPPAAALAAPPLQVSPAHPKTDPTCPPSNAAC
jgi:hypothetical protein